jgi:uncharacterized membrane protein (UPF0127 family)
MRIAVRRSVRLLAVAFTLGFGLCTTAPPAPAQFLPGQRPLEDLARFPTSTLEIRAPGHSAHFSIWIADTPPREEQGLMFVRDLPADRGMIFVEPEPRDVTMWMRNTYIPLDMVFIRADGHVAAIFANTVPFSETNISAHERVKAVLEIKGGEAARRGIKVGDVVSSPALAGR